MSKKLLEFFCYRLAVKYIEINLKAGVWKNHSSQVRIFFRVGSKSSQKINLIRAKIKSNQNRHNSSQKSSGRKVSVEHLFSHLKMILNKYRSSLADPWKFINLNEYLSNLHFLKQVKSMKKSIQNIFIRAESQSKRWKKCQVKSA